MPCPIWRDLAGIVAIGSCSSAADPLVRFFTTARTSSLQFRRKKAFSHMRLYQDAVRVEYRQGTLFNMEQITFIACHFITFGQGTLLDCKRLLFQTLL